MIMIMKTKLDRENMLNDEFCSVFKVINQLDRFAVYLKYWYL